MVNITKNVGSKLAKEHTMNNHTDFVCFELRFNSPVNNISVMLSCLQKTENKIQQNSVNSFPACAKFCRLLITFANSLDPDQAWHNVRPDLDPNCLTLWWYSWMIVLKKLIKKKKKKKKKHRWQKSMQNYPACKELRPPLGLPISCLISGEQNNKKPFETNKSCTIVLTLKAPSNICSRRDSKSFLFFFIFQRKQVLTFHVNHLPSRWFSWNVKTCFLWKKKKTKQKNCRLLKLWLAL